MQRTQCSEVRKQLKISLLLSALTLVHYNLVLQALLIGSPETSEAATSVGKVVPKHTSVRGVGCPSTAHSNFLLGQRQPGISLGTT